MAITVAELNAKLTADTSDFAKAMDKAEKQSSSTFDKIGKAGDKLKSVGTKLTTFATLPVLGIGAAAFKAAGDVGESFSKVNEVFGASAKEIDAWSKTSATAFGLSRGEALDAAGSFGNMFTQLKIGEKDAAKMSKGIVELAADFASFHNADISEVITAQSAAFRGEYDALQRFLPLINAATVEQKAMAMTGKANAKELTAQEKALAVNALMFEGAGKAAGDFARTSDGAANAQRIATAQLKDAAATMGEKLIPIGQKVIGMVSSLAEWFGNLSSSQQNTILIIGGLVAALGPAIAIIGNLLTLIKAMQVAMLFLAANPIVLIIAGIVALVAALVLAYKHSETFRDIVNGAFNAVLSVVSSVFNWVKNNWPLLLAILTGPIGIAVHQIVTHWDTIKNAITSVKDWIRDRINDIVRFFKEIPGRIGNIGKEIAGKLIPDIPGKGLIEGAFKALTPFHDGGVVPGPRGADVPIMAQAGETVVPAGAGGGMGGPVTIIVEGSVITERDLGRVVADALRDNGLIGVG